MGLFELQEYMKQRFGDELVHDGLFDEPKSEKETKNQRKKQHSRNSKQDLDSYSDSFDDDYENYYSEEDTSRLSSSSRNRRRRYSESSLESFRSSSNQRGDLEMTIRPAKNDGLKKKQQDFEPQLRTRSRSEFSDYESNYRHDPYVHDDRNRRNPKPNSSSLDHKSSYESTRRKNYNFDKDYF